MTCDDYEKWISDSLDGVLKAKKQTLLDRHLARCSSCKAYRRRLLKIKDEAERLQAGPAATSPYWENFSAAVRRRIEEANENKRATKAVRWDWRWAWIAALIGIVVFGWIILRPRPTPLVVADALRFEVVPGEIDFEIAFDPELAGSLNDLLWNSFGQEIGLLDFAEREVVLGDPLLDVSLSDEEWLILAEEIRKQFNS